MVSMENKIGVVLTLLHLASIMLSLMLINKMDPKPKRFDAHLTILLFIRIGSVGPTSFYL